MIVFDTEVKVRNKKIVDIGAISSKGTNFHNESLDNFEKYIIENKPKFFAGHNIVRFDLRYIKNTGLSKYFSVDNVVDTLYLSALFFSEKPYHSLVKDDKIVSDYLNNPLNDAKKSYDLLNDSINKFNSFDKDYKDIMYLLLKNVEGLSGFFRYTKYRILPRNLEKLISNYFKDKFCSNINLKSLINKYPLELAFALSYINTNDTSNSLIPPWILNNYSKVEDILLYLRNNPCHKSCNYCNSNLLGVSGLRKYFGYDNFRSFNGINLQELAVNSALKNEPLIAVFPTGGGKSLTFQIPALMAGDNIGGLTVVISPLQALMKDQVDNLYEKGITKAAYINGMQNPLERKETIERVLDGSISLLYIAPESLRSKTIERLLLKRQIVRFVIDEAHCFSTWGHDFRPDYLYIGTFIKKISTKKELTTPFPVSCFTATAKVDVIDDIKTYFKEQLNFDMKEFTTSSGRTNLSYQVKKVDDDLDRYQTLRSLLLEDKRPTIIYASRTKVIDELHRKLNADNFNTSKFHGSMDNDEKIANQNEFMNHTTNVMVATNAFGMGVDKDDVGVVIHYNISDSLENYVQEAGRAGRNPDDFAKCYILYNEQDLDSHFDLLNLNKISRKEIAQVWSGIISATDDRLEFTKTALEISKLAGWEEDNNVDTRIKTSILALEDAKLIERGLNSPHIFATSLLVKNFEQAKSKIEKSSLFTDNDKVTSYRIISSLISSKYKGWSDDIAESRVDYLSDNLGLEKETIIRSINLLKEIGVLANEGDLFAKVNSDTSERGLKIQLNRFKELFNYAIESFSEEKKQYNIKQLNEEFINSNYKPQIKYLTAAINYLDRVNAIERDKINRDYFMANLKYERERITSLFDKYFNIAVFIIEYLINKYNNDNPKKLKGIIDFSSIEIKNAYLDNQGLIKDEDLTFKDIEHVILMLHVLDVIAFEGGFLVSYSPMHIKRIEKNTRIRYTNEDYKKLATHYAVKNQQIHIVGRYAELMSQDPLSAEEFVSDYFNIDYPDFLDKYFPGKLAKELDYRMSKKRYDNLFGKLSKEQMEIINDDRAKTIGVAAGPGSGKTTLLIHKLASIIYHEDVKTNQLLMLTFSRNAATEFRERLKSLIGSVANYITITTFHSFAFDLLGRQGSLEASDVIINDALEVIRSNDADKYKITKTMLVIDEAQDMRDFEYELVQELINHNDEIRVIAVGDDDQNIFEFRKSDSKYLLELSKEKKYELTINFRSEKLIVAYANKFIKNNKNRLKTVDMRSNSDLLGEIQITNYLCDQMIMPLVNKLVNEKREGRTAVITTKNEEALIVSGLLTELGIENRLVQDLNNYRPLNVFEVREFYNMLEEKTENKIDLTIWDSVYKNFEENFKSSTNFEVVSNLLNKFIEVYNNPYISDLKEYLLQSEFYFNDDKVIVANIHKVKGLEFDNVYLLYDNLTEYITDDKRREIYVAITRAKSYLSVHTNNNIFKNIMINGVIYNEDTKIYEEPNTIELIMNLSDVRLNYFHYVNRNVLKLLPGDILTLEEDTLFSNGKRVAKLSVKGQGIHKERIEKGYKLESIIVNNMVYWFDREQEIETLTVIPILKYKKSKE